MPTRTSALSAALVPLCAVLGSLLVVLGLIVAVALGPSGHVETVTHVDSPGIALVNDGLTSASSSPVRVQAAAGSGGPVFLATALPEDATAVLGETRMTTIAGMRFLPRSLDVTTAGMGQLPRSINADIFGREEVGAPAAIDVTPAGMPQTVVVLPGELGSPRDDTVDITLTWENAAWFWQGVTVTVLGAALLVCAGLAQRRRGAQPPPETEVAS
ncbi:MAG: hypothetical protein ABI746_00700 [Dermatophilaceae bacterium]